jgi:hypothetical protein
MHKWRERERTLDHMHHSRSHQRTSVCSCGRYHVWPDRGAGCGGSVRKMMLEFWLHGVCHACTHSFIYDRVHDTQPQTTQHTHNDLCNVGQTLAVPQQNKLDTCSGGHARACRHLGLASHSIAAGVPQPCVRKSLRAVQLANRQNFKN